MLSAIAHGDGRKIDPKKPKQRKCVKKDSPCGRDFYPRCPSASTIASPDPRGYILSTPGCHSHGACTLARLRLDLGTLAGGKSTTGFGKLRDRLPASTSSPSAAPAPSWHGWSWRRSQRCSQGGTGRSVDLGLFAKR